MVKAYCPFCHGPFFFKDGKKFTCFSCGVSGDDILMSLGKDVATCGRVEIMEDACKVFQNNILLKKNKKYAEGRGLNETSIKSFRIGFSGNIYKNLHNKYSDKELIDAGLIKENKDEVFKDRLIFPIINNKGNVVGFGGRRTYESETSPKYLNSKETHFFAKRSNLYGINNIPVKTHQVFLVEGYMDVVSLHQHGVNTAVAALGTAVTEEHCYLMKSMGITKVIVALDSDEAGINAAYRASKILGKYFKIGFLSVPGAKDADEYMKSHDAEEFYNLPVLSQTEFLIKNYKTLNIELEEIPFLI